MRWQQFAPVQVTFDSTIGVSRSSKLPKMVVYLPHQKQDVASHVQGPERTKSQEARVCLALAPSFVSSHAEVADQDAVVAEAFAMTKCQK